MSDPELESIMTMRDVDGLLNGYTPATVLTALRSKIGVVEAENILTAYDQAMLDIVDWIRTSTNRRLND